MSDSANVHRVLIVGGGVGGGYTGVHLARLWRRRGGGGITPGSRGHLFLMTPFLFQARARVLGPRHAVSPVRKMLDAPARFVEADLESIDFERRVATARHTPGGGDAFELPYDQLVLALGGVTN